MSFRSLLRTGARSCAAAGQAPLSKRRSMSYSTALYRLTPQSNVFGARVLRETVLEEAADKQCVIIGELHGMPPVIQLQLDVLRKMVQRSEGVVHVVLEHFNFDMQGLLDRHNDGALSSQDLAAEYERIDTEGHNLLPYLPLLCAAQELQGRVKLTAGFIPRTYARQLMREGTEAALDSAKAAGYVGADESCDASDAHYNFFESLISGRDMHSDTPPSDRFRKMFPAQVIKDAAMAHLVSGMVSQGAASDRYLLLLGVGHMAYSLGVPERILARHPELKTYSIYSRGADHGLLLSVLGAADAPDALKELFGEGTPPAADVCFAFEEGGEA